MGIWSMDFLSREITEFSISKLGYSDIFQVTCLSQFALVPDTPFLE